MSSHSGVREFASNSFLTATPGKIACRQLGADLVLDHDIFKHDAIVEFVVAKTTEYGENIVCHQQKATSPSVYMALYC